MGSEVAEMGSVTEVSRADLIARRQRILSDLGMTYDELKARAASGSLLGEEQDALDTLKDIAFLLDE